MNYRRALLLVESGKENSAGRAVAVLRRVAPRLERLLAMVLAPAPSFAWLSGGNPLEREERDAAVLDGLSAATAEAAPKVDVQVAPELASEALAALCVAEEIDLLVFASRSVLSASVFSVQRRRLPVAVLWAEGQPAPGPIKEIGCVALDGRARAATGVFLRDHTDRTMHVTLLAPAPLPTDVLAKFLPIAGIESSVEISSPRNASSMRQWLTAWTRERPVDLLVFAGMPSALLLGALRIVPVLLLPPLPAPRPFGQRGIDVPDLVDDGGPLRLRVDHVATVRSEASVPDQSFAFVSAGEAELPAGLGVSSLGVYRLGTGPAVDPLAALEQRILLVRPGERPLVIFDSELPDTALRALRVFCGPSAPECLAIRLRPTRSCRSIRARLRRVGLFPAVLDARVVLDEGEALDVSDLHDPVRLARVASRLQSVGFPLIAMVHRGPTEPLARSFVALNGSELEHVEALETALAARGSSPSEELFGASEGNHIEIELDNRVARGFLLEAIASSKKSLHLQVYMVADDDVARQVADALAAAAARGVTVRVLVDSLHGLHGSFGTQNPLLQRLSVRPGVELRALRPITELPSLEDIKQRDHRKLVISDGRIALVGGRNLSHEYYTAFEEEKVTHASTWREVPWLDAGARIEGPAVAALSSAFLDAWTEAGGAGFEVVVPHPIGVSRARVVVHRGLRDARTLEMYLALVESARSHIYAVNGFPLALELQHALLRALRRGVRIRALIGHVAPTHDGQPFSGPWTATRTAATELVHSRMDPIVAAGGEVYLFARQNLPGWARELGVVHPHVHAKAMSVDGDRCAVGSANLDITASYWESELMLLVEDEALARAFEAQIDRLTAGSIRMNRDDAVWQQLAKRRAWMRHWPGLLAL
jgi:phosphatidylserine/phosphatidylglycerophosphate/cardiolipin synthase-like enzyme